MKTNIKLKIADAMNTYNVALLSLGEKGYRLWLEPSDKDTQDYGQWHAEKEERVFVASDPLRLSGLVFMWEERGDDWRQREGEEDLYSKLPKEAGV